MSDKPPGTIPGYPNLKPFTGADDPRRNPGNASRKALAARRRLAEFDDIARETLREMFYSGDWSLRQEALRFYGKYRLPVPTEKDADEELNEQLDSTALEALKDLTPQQIYAIASGRREPDGEH